MLWAYTKLLTLICFSNSLFTSTGQNFFLSIPESLYVEHANIIQLKTFDHVHEVTFKMTLEVDNTKILDEFVHRVEKRGGLSQEFDIPYIPSVLPPGKSIGIRVNVTLKFCKTADCVKTHEVSREERASLARRTPLLIGETEKPIYRPGETVRLRFLALSPQITIPLDQEPTFPKKQLVHKTGNTYTLEAVTEKEPTSLNRILFDEISVEDPEANRVKQWLRVAPTEAATLNFTLLKDASEGQWCINAISSGVSERVRFTVRHYVLPRFVLNINPPTNLTFDSNYTQFSVCAKYTNGPPMFGSVHAVLCVCNQGYGDDTQNIEAHVLLENRTCMSRYPGSYQRPCTEVRGHLGNDGCAKFNVSTAELQFRNPRSQFWGQSALVCAEVLESGTGSNVSKCEQGERIERRDRRIKINFPSVYRAGLPIAGTIEFENPNPSWIRDAYVLLTVTKQKNYCWPVFPYGEVSDEDSSVYTTKKLITDGEPMEFILPPTKLNDRLSLKATVVMLNDKIKRSTARRSIRPHHLKEPSDSLSAYHSISPFISNSKMAMQIWPTHETVEAKCPGIVSLKLLANTPIADKTIHIQTVVRGRLIKRRIPPASVDTEPVCVAQDGHLGHYNCLNDGRIKCLPGWTGSDCLYPICAKECHPIGGTCDVPHSCLCKDGWSGKHCEHCNIRSGCVHGKCVHGNDCVCESGWTGYLCDRSQVVHEKIPIEESGNDGETTKPGSTKQNAMIDRDIGRDAKARRTLYERNVTFLIDEQWGPRATIVLFFYDDSNNHTEIVATTMNLKNLENCTNSAAALQTQSEHSGIHFDAYKVSPGQTVEMTMKLVGLNETREEGQLGSSTMSMQTCFIRISDKSLSNFEGGESTLDLQQYANKVEQLHEQGHFWRPKVPKDVKQAFLAAGLRVITNYVTERIHVACSPRFYSSNDLAPVPLAYSRSTMLPGPPGSGNAGGSIPKPRLRDFFPEVWLFDVVPMNMNKEENGEVFYGFQTNLTTPDTLTSWQASAFCTTRSHGLWIPPVKQLTVNMPFFVEITLPKQVKRGEILYLPISLFVHPSDEFSKKTGCLEVQATTEVNDEDWLRVGPTTFSGCVCPGQKETFQLGLLPKRLGQLNITAEAYAMTGSALCSDDVSTGTQHRTFSDMLRRQIRVVPEGIPIEVTAGTMICIESDQTSVSQDFPMSPPEHMYTGSLRLYASFSDEVLGPALKNLNNLVRLPVGCGEQNMLLVAPNVYVMDYLMSTASVNPVETVKLVRTAKSHIVSGYVQQLKYRHEDGSYSAFGKSDGKGSTWLTAFVLRVFAKAFQVDPNLSIEWNKMLNDSMSFLISKRDADGCFVEEGRVIHAAMQGGLGSSSDEKKTMLLTAYVLAALHEMKKSEHAGIVNNSSIQDRGLACLKRIVSGSLPELETYVLAQLCYSFTLLDPNTAGTRAIQKELLERQQFVKSRSGELSFWKAQRNSTSDRSVNSADIETTAYAYLALTQDDPSLVDPFPIIRWLSSQQKSTGGFQSTQDTVLALQVISDGAKRLNSGPVVRANNDISITVRTLPDGEAISQRLTVDKRRILNQFAVPFTIEQAVRGFSWELKRATTGSRQCLAIQNTMHYNVPESTAIENNAFWISHRIVQPSNDDGENCNLVNMTICIRPGTSESLHRDSGMLLAQIHMVSGWTVVHEPLLNELGNESDSLRQVEFDDKGTTSLYFNGFSTQEAKMEGGWDNLKRCVRMNLKQELYVENAAPASISVRDYYDIERSIETSYSLDSCKSYWGIDEPTRPETDPSTTESWTEGTTTEPTLICPKCSTQGIINGSLSEYILDALCQSHGNLYLLNITGRTGEEFTVRVTTVSSSNYTASWNANVSSQSLKDCPCESITKPSQLILISPESMNIHAGDPTVAISYVPTNTLLLPVAEVFPSIEQAKSRWDEEVRNKPVSFARWGCRRIPVLYRYIKHKFLVV